MKNTDESSVRMPPGQEELFTADGHLTDSAFALLIQEKLDPLQSLEVSEHLSFCDRCLERYTAILCGEPLADSGGTDQTLPVTAHLIEPPQPLLPGILQKLKHRAQVFYLKKATSLVVAASLALVFWSGGLFTSGAVSGLVNNVVDSLQTSSQTILEQTGEISNSLGDFFRSLQGNFLKWKFSSSSPQNQ